MKGMLLKKLDKATDNAARKTINAGYPIRLSKKTTILGGTVIEKLNNSYNILTLTRLKLYENISTFDVATIIAQCHNMGDKSSIKKVLELEERFLKHHDDMMHYLHCMKGAKAKKDTDRMFILEDKFQLSEMSANAVKNQIQFFKRVK